jgi:heterotetrameric sarcosine oxidase gamma subunit
MAEQGTVPGLEVQGELRMHAAALRYFDREGPFAAAAHAATGAALPACLQAALVPPAAVILAWRSPTETLVLSEEGATLPQLRERLAGADGGQVVDLSGGLRVLRLRGPRVEDLLCRLGGGPGAPALNEARRGRLADVPVLALSVRPGETLLAVDRAYAEHLLGWIRATLADWS